jgi:hypothetical protein
MWGDVHMFDYDQQNRSVFYKGKCNFRIASIYFKKFLAPPPPLSDFGLGVDVGEIV